MTYNLGVNKRHLLLLSVIFLISLGIRLYLLDKRWINPDEGAHLMDAVLLLDGKIPEVDYGSRQPLYVYVIALFLKLFGTSYISGRLMPITCSMLTGIVVFLIARALFDENVGALSSAIYWMMPLEVINSTLVKTEPLVILLTGLSFYGLIRFWKSDRAGWLIGAGIFAALGYYVRQSSLIVPLCAVVFLGLLYRGRIRATANSLGYFAIGYLAVMSIVMVYYSRYLSLERLFKSISVSPFGTVITIAQRIIYRYAGGAESERVISHNADRPANALSSFLDAFDFHSFLLIGLLFSIVSFGFVLYNSYRREAAGEYLLSLSLLYLWVFSLFAAYSVYFIARRFGIDYFREFLPPLVIIFSAWVYEFLPSWVTDKEKITQRLILIGLPLLGILFVLLSNNHEMLGHGYFASIAVTLIAFFTFIGTFESSRRRISFGLTLSAILALILVSRQEMLKTYFSGAAPSLGIIGAIYAVVWVYRNNKIRPGSADFLQFIALSIASGALAVSVTYSAVQMNLAYQTVWSPESVARAAAYLDTHTQSGDEIISGAAIWEFQALRRPFNMISHPLVFQYDITDQEREAFKHAILTRPPKVIILDGYTEKTYLQQFPWISEIIQNKYELGATVEPAKYPVKIYLEKN